MDRKVRDLIARAREDIAVVFEKDPAATSVWEVLCYPHLHALWIHRLAHHYYLKGHRVGPRSVAALLHAAGYSLQASAKVLEGTHHADRNASLI